MSEGEDSADPDLSESGECQAPAGVVSDIPCPDTDKDIRFDRLVAVVVLYWADIAEDQSLKQLC